MRIIPFTEDKKNSLDQVLILRVGGDANLSSGPVATDEVIFSRRSAVHFLARSCCNL